MRSFVVLAKAASLKFHISTAARRAHPRAFPHPHHPFTLHPPFVRRNTSPTFLFIFRTSTSIRSISEPHRQKKCQVPRPRPRSRKLYHDPSSRRTIQNNSPRSSCITIVCVSEHSHLPFPSPDLDVVDYYHSSVHSRILSSLHQPHLEGFLSCTSSASSSKASFPAISSTFQLLIVTPAL